MPCDSRAMRHECSRDSCERFQDGNLAEDDARSRCLEWTEPWVLPGVHVLDDDAVHDNCHHLQGPRNFTFPRFDAFHDVTDTLSSSLK